MYFDEFIANVSGYTANTTLYGNRSMNFIVIYGNEKDKEQSYFKKSHLARMKKDDLIELWDNLDLGYNCDDYTKADLIDDLMRVNVEGYYQTMHENLTFREFDDEFVDYASRGYCQGDYVGVVFHNVPEKEWESLSQEIDHVFWDCPTDGTIYITTTTTDSKGNHSEKTDEIYVFDFMDDIYNHDIDCIVSQLESYLDDPDNKFYSLKDTILESVREYFDGMTYLDVA